MMKKNAPKFVDDTHVQVTKEFAKNARIFGTPEYKMWRAIKLDCPEAEMVTKSIKKNPNQKTRRNMTFKNMEEYIKTQPNAKELEEEFKTIKQRSKIQKSPYQYVLSWFEAKFEGFNDLDQFMVQKEAERKAKEAENNAASNEEEND